MRLIAPVTGTVVAKVSPDLIRPIRGALQREVIVHIAERYLFNIVPKTGQGVPRANLLQFESGIYSEALGGPIVIISMTVFNDGLAVTASSTDQAEIVMADLKRHLDAKLSYRYADANIGHVYSSQVVAQFSQKFIETTNVFSNVGYIISSALGADFGLKQFSFGMDADFIDRPPDVLAAHYITHLRRDFVIERRAGEPLANNIFFCSAPMRTDEHVALLEKIERGF